MIQLTNTSVYNFENAMRGARNPMNSWNRSDSAHDENGNFVFGSNDLDLAQRLCKAGSDHRKFLRQIFVSIDINAPMYWWKEFDTYKVGTTANYTSTMHKIHSKPFELNDFSHDRLSKDSLTVLEYFITYLEVTRLEFVESKKKSDWYQLIQLLPSSYNQLRTCSMSYENLLHMYHARKNHKLEEWRDFCKWVESLPYAKELLIEL